MIRIYKDHLKGSHHFSRVFLYIILHLCNKANFFKKRSEKNNLFNNCEKAFCLQKRIINEKKNRSKKLKKSVVVHFATSEISYFYFHYFLYIVLPKLHFLADYEKKKIIDNLYLINTNITDEDIQGHLYNKINEEGKCCSIIFCNDILPKEKYNYNNSLTIFLENASFLNIFVNLYQRKRMKKAPQLLIRKDQKRHISCAKSQYYNFNREFLKVQDRVNAAAGPNNCKTSFHYRINGRDEKRNFNKKDLVKEMKNNLNIYVWSSHQKENFYSSLVKMKFRKFYN
ncbi:hypothetical protein PMALA_043050 [Plasmodium malariae]|uniref:Uncharacterized protein n=1 Tax=Plasmodium malariae TaxID=5858 RepID=A0A1A8WPW7_PLAMA|nr:hypothetical protein PMALA_043050 [Plasmodium malariae]